MSFASAFLAPLDDDLETRVEDNVQALLQAVVPEPAITAALPHVRQSNLCFGVPMTWALAEGRESRQTRTALKTRLTAFEPRLSAISDIELSEDEDQNAVTFQVAGRIEGGEPVEIETRMSRLDQHVEESR